MSSSISLTVSMLLDGSEYLHIQGAKAWLVHRNWHVASDVVIQTSAGAVNVTWPTSGMTSNIATIPDVGVVTNAALSNKVARNQITIAQQPTVANGYHTIVLFNDDPPDGSAVYSATITLDIPDPVTPPIPPVVVVTTGLSWFQAKAEAMAGVRIRRAGWNDRWVEYVGNLWWLQLFNPTTKVLGDRRIIQAGQQPSTGDWSSTNFRSTDWTVDGITGQVTNAGTHHDDINPGTRFP